MLRSGKLIPKKGGLKRFKSTRGRNLPELTEKEGGEAVILLSLPFTLIYPEQPLSFILTGFRKMLNTRQNYTLLEQKGIVSSIIDEKIKFKKT